MHGFLVGNNLAHEWLAIHGYNLVASQKSCFFGRSVLDYILHMDGVLADNELDAHSREGAFEVVVSLSRILCTDIDGMRVELSKNLRYRLIHQGINVHGIHILVVDEVEQVVESVAATIDDVESVAGEMIRKECTDDNANHYAERHDEGHESVALILIHVHNLLTFNILTFLSLLLFGR